MRTISSSEPGKDVMKKKKTLNTLLLGRFYI